MKKFKIIFMSIIVAMMASCTVIDSSEVGIEFKRFSLTEQGKLDAHSTSGWVVYNPISTGIYTYPVTIQRVDYNPFIVTTKDAATFTMDPMLAYQINRDKAIDIFAKYRKPLKDIEAGFMRTIIYDAYRITANQYTSDELMANRGEFETKVQNMLDSALIIEGFIISEFTSQITPPQSLQSAIDAKNKAIQESLKAENLVKQAEANAKIKIAEAEGEAQALKIKADGEAYYNRTVAASLSDKLIQQYYIEKWNGSVPQYQGGGQSYPIIKMN
jgi:regulator of protease activity HflC (stomatin/prohibitin superfamily)